MASIVESCTPIGSRLHFNPLFVYENCYGTVAKISLTIETLALIRDSFPAYGCSVMTFDKSSIGHSGWVQSYAIIKGRHIFLTNDEKDQIPWRALPLDQITFHMNEKENDHHGDAASQPENLAADHDYSQFEIQVITKHIAANSDGREVR